jgi:hypothetical protein
MASSGNLARSFARALDLPEAVATTAMKVLRFEDMVTKNGRGTSAAMMSAKDAATFLVAIASGAVPSQIAEVTNFLLDMRKVATFSAGPETGFAAMRASLSSFYTLPDRPTLRNALIGLLHETSNFFEEKLAEGNHTSGGIDPQFDTASLRFMLGMDAKKLGGFAILRARVTMNKVTTHYFSTWPHRKEFTAKGDIDPLNCFDCNSGFLSIASFDGKVFSAAIDSFKEPVSKTRFRLRRFARP